MDNRTNFAQFIEDWLHDTMGVDLGMTQVLKVIILFVAMLFIALLLWIIGQWVIHRFISRLVKRSSSQWDDVMAERGVFRKLGHLVPAIVISTLTPVVLTDYPTYVPFVEKIMAAFIVLVIIRVVVSAIGAANIYLSRSPKYRDKPIASFTQLAKLIFWFIGVIIILAIVIGRNPIYMFSALGAVSAVLLLIFKDTILGFIASIQVTINDMVRIGDWVSMPKYGADGDVSEINLTTVKVINWDKTISTVPTYSFVSDSFVNWRGMQESGGRRIKRSISLKMSGIRFCDDEDLERYSKIQRVRGYIKQRKAEIEAYNIEHDIDTKNSIVNGRRMTNIGIFRAYILQYLRDNPGLNQEMTCMVRQLEPTDMGVPLEIYCFTATVKWLEYEGIQGDIFDHILATVGHFDLEVFESPAGSDFQSLGRRITTDGTSIKNITQSEPQQRLEAPS